MRRADLAVSQMVDLVMSHFGADDTPVAVVGMGKIGLPLAVHYALRGRRVLGCDTNAEVVAGINAGRSHVHEEPGLEDHVAALVARGRLSATRDTSQAVREAGVVVVIVPVAISPAHAVDYRALDAATAAVAAGLGPDKLVIYETTLPVGTTAQRLRRALEDASRLRVGRDVFLAYSPERVSSGHIFRDLATYPKVIGGVDALSARAAEAFYRSVLAADVVTMRHADDAEFVKLIETTYRDVNIALANEYARYADRYGLDVAAAIAAANTQPYSHIHDPGVGVGGHCIPVYPYFLLNGEETGLNLPRAARQINDGMAGYAVDRLEAAIGPLAGRGALILGVTYRANVREHAFSSAALLRDELLARGAVVYAHDPLYTERDLDAMGYVPLRPEDDERIAAVIVQAGHDAYTTFDFSRFSVCQAVYDGRRVLAREPVEALGMRYLCPGDGQPPVPRT